MLQSHMPKSHAPDHPCRMFSTNNLDDFVGYLRGVEDDADPLILALVRQLYGESR